MALDLEKLEQLAAQVTSGPWKVVDSDKYTFTVAILPPDFPQTPLVGRIRDKQDAAYIIAACNSAPELVAENRVLRERVQELERQRDWLVQFIEGYLDCDYCPYHKTQCTHIPTDCFRLISQKAEQAAKELAKANVDPRTTG